MNAPDPQLVALAQSMAPSLERIPRPAVTASEIAYEMAEAEFLASPAKYAAWLESVDGDRRMTLYFQAAMTEGELMAVQMSTSATVEQVYEATRELRWRYLNDQYKYIEERSIELQEPGTGYVPAKQREAV
jgi:hypothetical protein